MVFKQAHLIGSEVPLESRLECDLLETVAATVSASAKEYDPARLLSHAHRPLYLPVPSVRMRSSVGSCQVFTPDSGESRLMCLCKLLVQRQM